MRSRFSSESRDAECQGHACGTAGSLLPTESRDRGFSWWKRDLTGGKRDLVVRKRDLAVGKRDLVVRKRELVSLWGQRGQPKLSRRPVGWGDPYRPAVLVAGAAKLAYIDSAWGLNTAGKGQLVPGSRQRPISTTARPPNPFPTERAVGHVSHNGTRHD